MNILHLRLFALSRFQAPHMDRCFPFHFIVVANGNKMLWALSLRRLQLAKLNLLYGAKKGK